MTYYLKQIGVVGDLDPSTTIWRYLTLKKFESLLTTRALWFSKLEKFTDSYEGTFPDQARARANKENAKVETWFSREDLKEQVRRFTEDNEKHGRELIVANCWFAGNAESKKMWKEYVGTSEGVAIRSTIRDLAFSLSTAHEFWWIGKVSYVDLEAHDGLSLYEAHQAHIRAFIKSKRFEGENEVRVATMNMVAPGCLNPDGSPPNDSQRKGLTYSTNRPGIMVLSDLSMLMKEVRVAPGASEAHNDKLKSMIGDAGVSCAVTRSAFESLAE